MAKIQWQTAYETRIPTIDLQHKRLIAMINQLEEAVADGHTSDQGEIGAVLVQLVEYTQYHFSEEEMIQREIGFTEIIPHAEAHRMFIDEIRGALLQMRNGTSLNIYELMNFLRDWLLDHIMCEDRKIGTEYHRLHARHTSPLTAVGTK